ncbi:hypothetical protein NCS56_01285900 [Fusarium sp. Ph1]|nr:hypothetical protein NCS56_01285900 [Fusarium sp. Ph1]
MAVDLTVGIDVGMSGTGVAYRQHKTGDAECDFVCLKWGSNEHINKVPTKLAYARTGDSQSPLHWGLKIPDITENLSIKEWFKTDFEGNGSDHTSADKLYTDYLKCLHDELSERFVRDGILGKAWKHANIAFVFSTPACWEHSVVAQFKTLISKAGFEKAQSQRLGRGVHTVEITMTEPQATAAFELHSPRPVANLRRGQNVMIVDAGAGTVVSTPSFAAVGSRADLVQDFSLLRATTNAQGASHWLEHQPAIGQNIGSSYIDHGFEVRMSEILKPYQHLLGHNASHVAWEMRRGTRFLQDYLLLSGGLGSSPYVKRQLEKFCDKHPRLKSASNNEAVFPTIACRVSFGLVSRIPSAAPAKRTWISILTRGKGIESRFDDCVDWIIPKIQNGGELEFERKLFFEPDERRVCNIEIVYSLADVPSPSKDFIATHQVMRANLLEAEVKKKREVFWRKKYFLQVEFKVKATIGPAEAHFLCVDAGGRKISELITVPVPREPPIMGLDESEEE